MGEKIFAFSCCNFRGIKIAESVLKNHGRDCCIYFFDTQKKPIEAENCVAVGERISCCDISQSDSLIFGGEEPPVIYLCDDDGERNFNEAVCVMKTENIKPCGAELVVFGKFGCFDEVEKNGFRVRRVDEERLWAINKLYHFDMSRVINSDGLCVCIDGFGRLERELVKALSWLLIHEGELVIRVKASENQRREFERECPEMVCSEALDDCDEINYRIEFVEEFSESDRVIKLENTDFSKYYSEEILINEEVEQTALRIFSPWNKMRNQNEKFWKKEFYYRSSMASAMFWLLRKRYGLSIEVNEENLRIEHRRWNAYMRGEGYVYGGVRDHEKKTHHCLVRFDKLSKEEKSYDENPIRSVK